MRDQVIDIADDGQLLARVTGHNGDEAFAALVLRHRDFVHRVCRRVLGNADEAEDATQQVFMVLSERAGMLVGRTSIVGWLYRTAWQVSLRARRGVLTRQNHERSAAKREGFIPPLVAQEADSIARLHEIVGQLPEHYQEAVVLHYFSGYTVAEVAARLKCPPGTVASRISRGLQLIRYRLGDRGLIITVVALKALLLAEGFHAKAAMAGGVPLARGAALRFAPQFRLPGRGVVGVSALFGLGLFGARWSDGAYIAPPTMPLALPFFDWASMKVSLKLFGGPATPGKVAAAVLFATMVGTTCYAAEVAAINVIAGPDPKLVASAPDGKDDKKDAPKSSGRTTESPSGFGDRTFRIWTGPVSTPEPGSLSVLIIAGAATLARRRRSHPRLAMDGSAQSSVAVTAS